MAGRRLSEHTRSMLASGLVGVALQACVAVSGVLAARLLGPTDRGNLALLWLVPLALAFIGGAAVPTAATYYVAKEPGLARAIVRRLLPLAVGQVVALMAIQAVILAVVVVPSHDGVGDAALVSLAAIPALLFSQYAISVIQGLRRFGLFNGLRLLPVLGYAIVLVVLAATGGASLAVVMGAWSGTWLLAAVVSVVALARTVPPAATGEAPSRRTLVGFGTRTVLGTVSPVDDLQLDQILVGFILAPRDLGLYAAGLAFTNLPRFVAQSIGMVAYPRIAAQREPADAEREFWAALRLAVPAILALVVVIEALAGELVPLLFGASFDDAVGLARLLLLGSIFFALRRLLSDGARGLGHPSFGAVAEVVALVVLLAGVAGFVPWLGVDGVAVATGLSSLASVVVLVYLIRSRPARPAAAVAPELAVGEPGPV